MISKYWLPAKCSNCGAEGVTDSEGNSAQWHGRPVVHVDKQICVNILKAKLKEGK